MYHEAKRESKVPVNYLSLVYLNLPDMVPINPPKDSSFLNNPPFPNDPIPMIHILFCESFFGGHLQTVGKRIVYL